jgi:glucose/arabinose dehydrogenase
MGRTAWSVMAAAVLLVSCSGSDKKEEPRQEAEPEPPRRVRYDGPRAIEPRDIQLPPGYDISVVATELTFPTSVTFDELGVPYVVEAGYAFGDTYAVPRIVRIVQNNKTVVAQGQRNGPWNGAVYNDHKFYVAEGGLLKGGRILQVGKGGEPKVLASGMPSRGDHQTSGPALGADGMLYFSQGTVTNAGVVGPDNDATGWLLRFPRIHDVPCRDVTLAGRNFTSPDVLDQAGMGLTVQTGAYKPFGQTSHAGEVIPGHVPCNGAVMRVDSRGGGEVELIAWGLRNPFGLAFNADGRLFVTDHGYDARGSREVRATADLLWEVKSGAWYGWPDFGSPAPDKPVLARPVGRVPEPVVSFGEQASPGGLDFSSSEFFGYTGEAFVALFGDRAPRERGARPAGFKVVRVNTDDGAVEDFAVNRAGAGPASEVGGGGFERPIAARFAPRGMALYVVDFGVVGWGEYGPEPKRGTGVLWRITRRTPAPPPPAPPESSEPPKKKKKK